MLFALRAAGRVGEYPSVARFVAGAFPHAVWTRTEGWTMESVFQDLRYAVRLLRRAPGFTAVAALTLALGIGANAAIFSLVNGLMLRPPAGIVEPERIVLLGRSFDQRPRWDTWSWPAVRLIAEDTRTFSGVAGHGDGQFILGLDDDVEAVAGQYVTGSYFEVLGVRPALGRLLGPQDAVAPGGHAVVVLSHGLWVRRFGADPDVVGRTLAIGARPYEVVGVAPEAFTGTDAVGARPEIWVSAMQFTLPDGVVPNDEWRASWLEAFGRLQGGVTYASAVSAMDAVSMALRSEWEGNGDIRVALAPGIGLAPEERERVRGVSLLLATISALVLLLTCANVGNLFLTRAAARAMEVGVRQALGAGRIRLTRQLVTEGLVLAAVATVLSVPLVVGGSRVLPLLLPVPLGVSVAPDLTVFLFLGVAGLAAGLLFGIAPAWSAARRDVARTLREGGTTGGRTRTRLRDSLVVGQLAISLGLVSSAALLGRSIVNAWSAHPGFDPNGIVVGFVNLGATGRYDRAAAVAFQDRLLAELEAIPGVASAALASQAPILGGHGRSSVNTPERPEREAGVEAEYTTVTPGYFETLGIPLLRGRAFGPAEDEPEPVVVVNEALARRFWPGEDPLGKELVYRGGTARVVGVAADVQMRSLRDRGGPGVYYPHHEGAASSGAPTLLAVHVRTRSPAPAAAEALRRAVAAVDPEVPVTGITDLREGLARSLVETRTIGLLATALAVLALLISLVGLYGLISHGVAQRSREMGIRIALGAASGALMQLVMARALALAAVGTALGIGVSVALGTALQGLLYGVSPASPPALGMAAALLLGAALLAAWVPARRAARVDAMVSLRD
jgi:putative ABC transport system permease protein